MYLYQKPGKKLKKAISVLNPIGYLISDLVGVGAGFITAKFLRHTALNGYVASLICVLVASLVAAIPVLYVWVRGLIWYNISEAAEKGEAPEEQDD